MMLSFVAQHRQHRNWADEDFFFYKVTFSVDKADVRRQKFSRNPKWFPKTAVEQSFPTQSEAS